MTEAEWLACIDPVPMVGFLQGKASDRKLRLLGVAATRRVWHLLHEWHKAALEGAERFADGAGTQAELDALIETCWQYDRAGVDVTAEYSAAPLDYARSAVDNCAFAEGGIDAAAIAGVAEMLTASPDPVAERAAFNTPGHSETGLGLLYRTNFRDLLQDIFGNPFRPTTCPTSWRSDTAVSLARVMYESRDFGAMPILADALQDAGCDNENVLNHCRGEGVHVRGCWVLDLVLGKE